MMPKTHLLLLWMFLAFAAAAELIEKVDYLDAGSIIDFRPLTRHRGFFENDMRTYCYRGSPKTLSRLFETVELQLEIEGDDYTQYDGADPAEVRQHYDEQRSLFSFNLFTQKRSRLQLSPFEQQCIGIETVHPYRVRLQLLRVDFWRVIQLIVSVALFMYASQLSHNSIFYYITGILLGICSSFMLLIWLTSKLMPRRPLMYGMLIGGWTIGIYIIQMLWENLQVIVLTYRTYVFWYILVTGILSFFLCYRLGPPKNKRSKNIVKWLLQLISLLLIYLSSHFEEATVAIIILTITINYFPRSLLYKSRAWYLRWFPPKPRLLSSEEFIEQGARETAKALEELRAYASSPDCKQWKVMSKLRDPMRFAAFVEGASHLRDDEILRFESSNYEDELDDSDLSLEEEEMESTSTPSNGRPYLLQRSQRDSQINRRISVVTRDDLSEDDDNDEEDNLLSAQESNYNMRPTIRHHITPDRRVTPNRHNTPKSNQRITSTYVDNYSVSQNHHESPLATRSSASRIQSRSARMLSSAQRNKSINDNTEQRFADEGRLRHVTRPIDSADDQ